MNQLSIRRLLLSASVLSLSICAGSLYAQTRSNLANAEQANRVLGSDVRASNGDKVGTVKDAVIDLESGRILYLVVDAGKQDVAVPPTAFSADRGRRLDLNVDRSKLEGAPVFRSSDQDLGQASFVSQVHRYFGQNEWWQGSGPADQGSFHNVHRASDLRNVRVLNVNDEEIGDVQTLVLDVPAGRVLYVLLDPAKSLNLPDKLYALPPQTMTKITKNGKTVFSANVTKDKLASAPRLTSADNNKLMDTAFASSIYQYYGKDPYFTSTGSSSQPTPTGRSSGQYDTTTQNTNYDRSSTSQNPAYDRTGNNSVRQDRISRWNRGNTTQRPVDRSGNTTR